MFDVVVCGNVYVSLSVEVVLSVICVMMIDAGAAFVVMNYIGDRLNFGLVVECVKFEGFDVEMVIVNDDCVLVSD